MQQLAVVLPSARAIRYRQLAYQKDTLFLPDYITMSDFLSKLSLVEGYKSVDEEIRTLLLLEAANFENFAKLKIERNFFTFLKNSTYIFNFFRELSAELCDIDTLRVADVYAEFDEHVEILSELYKNYEKILDREKIIDTIFLPKKYRFNADYVERFEKIEIHVDGYLTNFELKLLEQCCEYTDVVLVFKVGYFNKKMKNKLENYGVMLQNGYEYTISLNAKNILSSSKLQETPNVSCSSVSEELLQIAFIKQKLYEFAKKGYKPENIAVVMPNEKSAEFLKLFDEKTNFNFAMGESFRFSSVYRSIQSATMMLEQNSKENTARLKRIGEQVYQKLFQIYHQEVSKCDIFDILISLAEYIESKEERKVYEAQLYKFEQLIPYMKDMSVKSFVNLFLVRLSQVSLNDIRGGKVTVMGVLETRSIAFDGVIIIDFDQHNVPKRSDKDMFLNTQVRENAQLPTMQDREELQKHYYEMLLQSTKEAAIVYVDSQQSSGSKFLKQLNIEVKHSYDENELSKLLFSSLEQPSYKEENIVLEYSFKDLKISNSQLKTYLSCKRKYYYAYIKSLKNHIIPKDMPQEYEIGNSVHEALKNLYTKRNRYDDLCALEKDLTYELERVQGESELDHFLILLQKKRLERFCKKEIEHFRAGWEVLHCEKSFEIQYNGMQLRGTIDRIDKRGNEILIIDYKTGSYKLYNKNNVTDATDFQLEFYYLLAASLSGDIRCAFYDLKEIELVPELFLEQKLELLKSHLHDLQNIEEISFEKCEDQKVCQYCEYKILCGR